MQTTPDILLHALIATAIAGFGATAIGAVPAAFINRLNEKLNNNMLSFAAGVMLAATIFSLLLPGIEGSRQQGYSNISAITQATLFLFGGGFILWAINEVIPHEHFEKGHDGLVDPGRLRKIWLFVIAIAIHNFPEGLAVGIATGSGDLGSGMGTTLGIGLQNIPEGLSVAVALRSQGYSTGYAIIVTSLTGLVEVVGGVFGASVLLISGAILPWALAFSAGAMLFIVSDEIIPETHRPGFENGATLSLFIGFGLMMFMDAVFSG